MALSTADLVGLYNVGNRFVTVAPGGKLTMAFDTHASAVKAAGVAGSSVAKLAANGTYTTIPNTAADTHDFGKKK